MEAAKARGLISKDQLPPPAIDLMFTEGYKSRLTLPGGRKINFRPLLPSDEFAYRSFFYSLREETIFYRFFSHIDIFSHGMAQRHWASLDYRKYVTLVGLVRNKGINEIMSIATYAHGEEEYAEVAVVVREDFQGMGVARHMLIKLAEIAQKNGYQGFTATVLPDNAPMLHLFESLYPGLSADKHTTDINLKMDFPK